MPRRQNLPCNSFFIMTDHWKPTASCSSRLASKYACLICVTHMCDSYVWLICVHHMRASYVWLICVSHMCDSYAWLMQHDMGTPHCFRAECPRHETANARPDLRAQSIFTVVTMAIWQQWTDSWTENTQTAEVRQRRYQHFCTLGRVFLAHVKGATPTLG